MVVTDAESELIALNTAQQQDGIYELSEINGVAITNFDMVLMNIRYCDCAGTGLVGQIAVQVSPDGGTTWRHMSGVRLNNNTTDANWNTYTRTAFPCLMGTGATNQEFGVLLRNLNNPLVPTTIEFWNQETAQLIGGGVFDDGTLGNYVEEAHNMIRVVIQDSAFTTQAFTAGTMEVTGWRGHRRDTTVLSLSASGNQTVEIPSGYTLGEVVYNLDLAGSTDAHLRLQYSGTQMSGASDYSHGYARKGTTYVKHASSVFHFGGNGNTTAPYQNKTNDFHGFFNLFNLRIAAPAMAQGYAFHTTGGASQAQQTITRSANVIDTLKFNWGAAATGKIWVVLYKRTATVTNNSALPGTSEFAYINIMNGAKDPNNLLVLASHDLGTTANTGVGVQARRANGTWLTTSEYPAMYMYSVGDGDTYHDMTHFGHQSGTDHGLAIAFWNATWFDKQGNRGSRPTYFGNMMHPVASSLGNGARVGAGCIVTGIYTDELDQYRISHTGAASTKLTGTPYAVKYEMI